MLKLMIVDDELWVRERFSERVNWDSIGVHLMGAASDAEEAIEWMEKERPHILLTDITMPGMNGLELAAYVRTKWPKVKIVILTAYGEFAYAQRAISLGVTDYLMKMAKSPEHILDTINQIAQNLHQEIDANWQLVWHERKKWGERMLDGHSQLDTAVYPAALSELIHQERPQPFAILAYGWDIHRIFGGLVTEERILQLQAEAGRIVERKLVQQILESTICSTEMRNAVAIPYRENRLFVFLRMPDHAGVQSELVMIAKIGLDLVRSIVGAHSFTYVGNNLIYSQQWVEAMLLLREGLSGYFYRDSPYISGLVKSTFQRIDPEQSRKWISAGVRSLEQGLIKPLRRTVSDMMNKVDPPYFPPDLLLITQKMLDPAHTKLPTSVITKLDSIRYIEKLADFQSWWNEALADIERATGEQGIAHMRKEVRMICKLIHERYTEDLQVTELARFVDLHPSYAGQLFKQETGEHISDYLNRTRIRKAEELLRHTMMKIYEVAQAVGIPEYRYFCKLFKSITGSTPTEYKKSSSMHV
ncbi:response regulator [Paenibacillus sp. LjRoot153]|uniref:response regulator transcription factor n=1 Tax=Paenibacillus sp. LjRoot153 TaxID=3342270 RepID=UPI003ECD7C0D